MATSGFQDQVRRLGELVSELEQMGDGPQKTTGRELVQLLMDVHGQGLERMMEVIYASRESGTALIDELGKDEIAGGLLLLYSLHPDALETRVHNAVERMRPRLRKLSCAIDLLNVDAGVVRVRVTANGHRCGSSAGELRGIVENGLYELAPDIAALEISGLEEAPSSDFVPVETLLGNKLVGAAAGGRFDAKGGSR